MWVQIEAPGAKEVVWGASIFHLEAPNFEINMVKEDSEKSVFFRLQTHKGAFINYGLGGSAN